MSQIPRFIVCQNPRCQRVKAVRRPSEQRTQKYCSRHCSNQMTRNLTPEANAKGGRVRAHRVRMQILLRINGLSSLQAFRLGYRLGLEKRRRIYQKRQAA